MKAELLYITENPEQLIELCGRTAYQSFDKIMPNSSKKFIEMLIKKQHFSVFEHCTASIRISGISRSCSHQLVRHRIASYTQKSQRYCNEEDFTYVEPESIRNKTITHEIFKVFMESAQKVYDVLQTEGIRNEDARFVLPEACTTEIIMTTNFREWRHIIKIRTDPAAQWEIRELCKEILKILKEKSPSCFGDL